MDRTERTIDLASAYLDLAPGGGVKVFDDLASFWPDLMAGRIALEGRLVATFDMAEDWSNWEMHPEGEEVLILLSGRFEMVLDGPGEEAGERTVTLHAGEILVVPRGVWHRAIVREPGRLVAITAGEGTQHRPFDSRG